MRLLGLDGCKDGAWVVAESDSEFCQIDFRIITDLKPILDAALNDEAVAVLDVPIGLSHEDRLCDKAARALLGPQGGSAVFRTPCREALCAMDYDSAKKINREHCGVAISRQSFGIAKRIKAVDDLITPAHQDRIREGHPEVAFAALNGACPLANRKSTAAGARERMALLRRVGVPDFDPNGVRERLGKSKVDLDDIIDAAAMLASARAVQSGAAITLPERDWKDERGLRMQMSFPSSTSNVVAQTETLQETAIRVRHLVNRVRRHAGLLSGSTRDWNVVGAALDMVQDTAWALETYLQDAETRR